MNEFLNFSEWRQGTEYRDPREAMSGIKLNKRGRPVMPNHKARGRNREKREAKAWPIYRAKVRAFQAEGNTLDHYEIQSLAMEILRRESKTNAETFLMLHHWIKDSNSKWSDPTYKPKWPKQQSKRG